MAKHLRTQLRQALADLLTNEITADGDVVNVFKKRVHAVAEAQLPAAFIVTPGEDADAQTNRRPFLNDISVNFEIDLVVADNTDVDDVIDDACLQIQHLIAGAALAGAKWIKYRNTRIYEDDDNKDIMRADLSFTAYFIAAENAVDVAL